MEIDSERLRSDLEANAAFGGFETDAGPGRTVLTGSEADGRCRDRLCEALEEAGCTIRIDPVGNIVGRWVPPGVDPDTAPIAMGSHLDSVPRGGIFDGPLGVYGALESLRTMQAGAHPSRPVHVVSFTEEEGARFGTGVLGSSVACGRRDREDALALTDEDGYTLAERLEAIGYYGDDEVDPDAWAAWAELHIEQGVRLETGGANVGVVDRIAGLTNCQVSIEGEADHAGTTGMHVRRDALTAAAEVIQAVEDGAVTRASADASVVGTVGRLSVDPNAKNTIPGHTELVLDLRAGDAGEIDGLVGDIEQAIHTIGDERDVTIRFDRYRDTPPTTLSDSAIEAATAGVAGQDLTWERLHSGAIHDTAMVATCTDAVMLFAPSRDGVSHSPAEWTDWEACARATEGLLATMRRLANA